MKERTIDNPPTLQNVSPFQASIKVDKDVQTDAEKFFTFILDFLSLLESRISSGAITFDEVISSGREVLEQQGIYTWAYETPTKPKIDNQTIQELQLCLQKIKSIRSYGGDVFFAGLGRVFAAQPIVPQAFQE